MGIQKTFSCPALETTNKSNPYLQYGLLPGARSAQENAKVGLTMFRNSTAHKTNTLSGGGGRSTGRRGPRGPSCGTATAPSFATLPSYLERSPHGNNSASLAANTNNLAVQNQAIWDHCAYSSSPGAAQSGGRRHRKKSKKCKPFKKHLTTKFCNCLYDKISASISLQELTQLSQKNITPALKSKIIKITNNCIKSHKSHNTNTNKSKKNNDTKLRKLFVTCCLEGFKKSKKSKKSKNQN